MGRKIGLLIALIAAAGGCGRSEQALVTLRLANWGGAGGNPEYEKLISDIYREFERDNPGVRIRVENNPEGYVPKMLLSFMAKTEPDIMMLDASSSALFINNGVLKDLSPLITRDSEFRISDFWENAVAVARRDGQLFAIPQDFTPMVMYYNKRLFDAARVPYPSPDWNFDKFLETAKALTVKDKQYGFAFQNGMFSWVMWLWNNGTDVVSPDGTKAAGFFDSKASVDTIKFLTDLVTVHKVSPSISQAAAMGVDPFANGQAAMTVSGHWAMIGYANAPKGPDGRPMITWDDLGIVALPHNTPESHTVMYESGYAIGKNCRNTEIAWKFIKYMTSYDVQRRYNASGIAVCGRKDVAEERAKIPLEAQFIPLIKDCRPPYGSWIDGYAFVEPTGQAAVDSIIQNGNDVQTALSKAAKRIDREFAKR